MKQVDESDTKIVNKLNEGECIGKIIKSSLKTKDNILSF